MKHQDPWLSRLEMEHASLKEYCNNSDLVSFSASLLREGLPPDRYLIKYDVKSIVAIDSDQQPIYAYEHYVNIDLPHDYPMVSGPICKMASEIWHPNIRHDGPFKGRICINSHALGAWFTLDLLVHHLGEMIQFKNYHADDTQPYPEDPTVAKWVKTIAEPSGLINKHDSIAIDHQALQKPSTKWLHERQNGISIKTIKLQKEIQS